jgi:hypothetical protein
MDLAQSDKDTKRTVLNVIGRKKRVDRNKLMTNRSAQMYPLYAYLHKVGPE